MKERNSKVLSKGDIVHISPKLDDKIILVVGDKVINLSSLVYKAIQDGEYDTGGIPKWYAE